MQDGSGGFSQDAVYDSARQGPVAPARLREAVQYVQNGDIATAKAAAGMASGREARRPRALPTSCTGGGASARSLQEERNAKLVAELRRMRAATNPDRRQANWKRGEPRRDETPGMKMSA